jgi:predicted nucleic acid-binding protein
VSEVVLDASVVLKWFRADGERHLEPARSLRARFERGDLIVFAPPLLRLEIVNVAGRRWRWTERALLELAAALDELGFELIEPDLDRVAHWTARGLTAYDAAYVVVAEANNAPLLTDDDLIVAVAGAVATGLADTPS